MLHSFFNRCRFGFLRVKRALIFFCLLVYLMLIRLSGATLTGVFLFWLCLTFYLILPGRLLLELTGMKTMLPEGKTPLSILLGTGFLCVTYCFCMRLGFLWVLRILPPLLALV